MDKRHKCHTGLSGNPTINMYYMKIRFSIFCLVYSVSGGATNLADISSYSLDDLLNQRASLYQDSDTASGTIETIKDAPAAIVVIDANMIQRRGYNSLDDILPDLPGFDTIVTNGTMQTVSYQRGYRTPWTQRTLLMINGRVDNNLWNHSAQISRQYPMNIIERIEVLYGPAGAVYGPNAFLGVINIITRDAGKLSDGESYLTSSFQSGSFNTKSVDIATGGKDGSIHYSLAARLFRSDEADINNYSNWGYTSEDWLKDPDAWGNGIGQGIDPATSNVSPAGDINVDGVVSSIEKFNGEALGEYADPSDDMSLMAEIGFNNLKIGYFHWKTNEAYGPYYSFADVQPNASWVHESTQFYVNHNVKKNEQLNIDTELVMRESRVGGDWVESFGNFVSISSWNSYNTSIRLEQKYNFKKSDTVSYNGGIKFEQKDLTKAYMACNYYDGTGVCPDQAANSSNGSSSDGSGVIDASLISSTNPSTYPPILIDDQIPTNNVISTTDIGGYIQGIWNHNKWRFNASVRVDDNSEYGSEINPRGAIIYHQDINSTYKIIYGEAIQEPSPKDLYGGFSARLANPNLVPEKVKNIEFIMLKQYTMFMHDASVFYAQYENAIAGGQNVGGRDIAGLEYRGKFKTGNFLFHASDISGNLFYTYTRAMSEKQYDNVSGLWVNDRQKQGDVAPHKINFLINMPVNEKWNISLATNWVSDRDLFSQNPLRADSNSVRSDNRQAKSYTKVDLNLLYRTDWMRLGFRIENVLEEEYLLPGVEGAGSGDDFTGDMDGFQNSLIPQVKDRVYMFNMAIQL